MTIKTVCVLETFSDIVKLFSGAEWKDIPKLESTAKVHVDFGEIKIIDTKMFIVSDEIKEKGPEFIFWLLCNRVSIPSGRLLVDENIRS